MSETLWIILLRGGEILLAASPTILSGFLLGGSALCIPRSRIDRAGQGTMGIANALLLGVLLPVCSIGAIPVVIALAQRGLKPAPLVALALSAGLAHPWSLAYGLSIMPAGQAALVVAASLLVVLLVAAVMFAIRAKAAAMGASGQRRGDAPPPAPRLLNMLLAAARLSTSSVAAWVVLAIIAAALVAASLPAGWIGHELHERNARVIPLLAAILPLAYTTPEIAMLQVREILLMGANPGAALAWLTLGSGANLALLIVLSRSLDHRQIAIGLVVLLMSVVLVGAGVDAAVFDGRIAVEDSHAFDPIGRPFHLGDEHRSDGQVVIRLLRRAATMPQAIAVGGIGLLVLLGWLHRAGRIQCAAGGADAGGVHRKLMIVGAGAVVLAVAISAVYAYYPAPRWTFHEIRHVDAELSIAVRRRDLDAAQARLDELQRLVDRLHYGALLRRGVGGTRAIQAAALREELAIMRAGLTRTDGQDIEQSIALSRQFRAAEQRYTDLLTR